MILARGHREPPAGQLQAHPGGAKDLCMYACMYVCIYIYIYIYIHTQLYIYIYIYIVMHIDIYTNEMIYDCICMYM